MKEMTIKELYTLEETIAKDIFEGATYPWEVLPKIGSFIKELGETLSSEEYDKMSGSRNLQMYLSLHIFTDLPLSGKMRKCVTVLLSAATPLSEKEQLWAILQS